MKNEHKLNYSRPPLLCLVVFTLSASKRLSIKKLFFLSWRASIFANPPTYNLQFNLIENCFSFNAVQQERKKVSHTQQTGWRVGKRSNRKLREIVLSNSDNRQKKRSDNHPPDDIMETKNCSRLLAIVMLMTIVEAASFKPAEYRTEAQMYYDQIPVESK